MSCLHNLIVWILHNIQKGNVGEMVHLRRKEKKKNNYMILPSDIVATLESKIFWSSSSFFLLAALLFFEPFGIVKSFEFMTSIEAAKDHIYGGEKFMYRYICLFEFWDSVILEL